MLDFRENIYNKEIKERFLNSIDLEQYPSRWWERLFEKSYIIEEPKQKDLYSFTTPEILEFYKFLDIGTIAPLVVYNTNLVIYAQWALNENLITDGQNHYDVINSDILSTCLNNVKLKQSILSYKEFLYLINHKIVNDQDKFVFFCLWEGIKGKNYIDIVNLKLSDINEENQSVELSSGRTVYVSKEFIDIAKAAERQIDYVLLIGDNKPTPLIDTGCIFKEKSNSRGIDICRTVYNTIVRNINTVDGLNDVVSANSIRDSGLIYHLNQRADKLGITVEELIYSLDDCMDIFKKYTFDTKTRKRWRLQYKDFLH